MAASGYNHSAALKKDGTLWTWGKNSYGQLGNGTNINSRIPVKVSSKGLENHEWNIVRINDLNYQVDSTWNDPTPDKGKINHMYFNISDTQMAKDHVWQKDTYPVCNTDNEYKTLNEKIDRFFAYSRECID